MTKDRLAFQYANKAFKENRKSYLAYSVLAEAYALLGDTKNFYETLEMALQNGFPLHENLDEPAYERYLEQEQFQALLKKYPPKLQNDNSQVLTSEVENTQT